MPMRRLAVLFYFLAAVCWAPGLLGAVEIHFYQRGYVEGGADAATSLTLAAVRAFERQRPDVQVRIVGIPWGQEGDLKLRTALLARRKIDCFRLAADQLSGYLPARGRLLAPVDDELSPRDRQDFGPALDAVSRDGHIWAWPLWSTAVTLAGNPDLLARAGVALPPAGGCWSWAQFKEALARLGRLRDASGRPVIPFTAAARPPVFEWAPLLTLHCGPFFATPAGGSRGVPLAAGLARALDRVHELQAAGLLSPGFGTEDMPAAQALFLDGRLGLLMTSPGFLRSLAARGQRVVILPPPLGEWGQPITTGGLGCFSVVSSGSPERERAAQALCRWLTSAELASAVPGWYLAPPARRSVTSFYAQPLYAPFRDILPTVRYLAPPCGSGFFEETVIPQCQAAALGQRSARQAIDAIQDAWQRQQLD